MVNEMLQDGAVSESCSPWASPVFLVKKMKFNGDLRICGCLLYDAVMYVSPIPRIDDLLDQLSDSPL